MCKLPSGAKYKFFIVRPSPQESLRAPRFHDVGEFPHLQRSIGMAPAKKATTPSTAPTGIKAPSTPAPAAAPASAPVPAAASTPTTAAAPITAPAAAQPLLQQDKQESSNGMKDLLQMLHKQMEKIMPLRKDLLSRWEIRIYSSIQPARTPKHCESDPVLSQ